MSNKSGDELVDVINDTGLTVGTVTRRQMRARRLPHRCTYILVFNSRGQLFIHLRTSTKDVHPSQWDVAVGGVVAAGESFAQGAARELSEELGIDVPLEELFPFRYAGDESIAQALVYKAMHDGPFRLQAEEIVRGAFMDVKEMKELARRETFCPDGLQVWEEYERRVGALYSTCFTQD